MQSLTGLSGNIGPNLVLTLVWLSKHRISPSCSSSMQPAYKLLGLHGTQDSPILLEVSVY